MIFRKVGPLVEVANLVDLLDRFQNRPRYEIFHVNTYILKGNRLENIQAKLMQIINYLPYLKPNSRPEGTQNGKIEKVLNEQTSKIG